MFHRKPVETVLTAAEIVERGPLRAAVKVNFTQLVFITFLAVIIILLLIIIISQ